MAEQEIIKITGTNEWISSYFDFWCIWNKTFSQANKWGIFKNYFLEKILLTSVLSYLENFLTFSGKLHWLTESLPVNVLGLQPAFLFKKRRLLPLISKVSVWKRSSKCSCFESFQKLPGNYPWWGIFVCKN